MSWITHARLRRDTPQARQLANQLLTAARWDGAHGLVWNLFADNPDASRDFLYRESDNGCFLVVSEREPRPEPAIWEIRSRPYAPTLAAGARFGFSLRANPTVSLSQSGRARSHRADVMMEAKRLKGGALTAEERETVAMGWLDARAGAWGVRFDLDLCGTGRQDCLRISRSGPAKKGGTPRIALTVVDYEGVLTVKEPERLRAALMAGVGRGKAFGMGLLLLRRLDN